MATFELKDLGNEIWNIMTSFIAHGIKTPALVFTPCEHCYLKPDGCEEWANSYYMVKIMKLYYVNEQPQVKEEKTSN